MNKIYTYECYGFEFSLQINSYWETIYKGKPRAPLYGAYTILLDALKRTTSKDRYVLDIGLNNAIFAIPANKLNYKVIGFEPVLDTFNNAKASIELNGLKDIDIFNLALANVNGELDLYVPECSDNASFNADAAVLNMKNKTYEVEKVQTVRFDDWIVDNPQYSDIGFIKLDAQGSEFDIISGASEFLKNSNDIYICCEFEPLLLQMGHTYEELESLLFSLGFYKLPNLTSSDRFFHKK